MSKNARPPARGAGLPPSPRQSLDPFDALLTEQRPFGDSGYLHEQTYLRYQQRLGRISDLLPIAGALSGALERAAPHRQHRTLGDPVVRHAIHQALRHVWNGPQEDVLPVGECEEIFRETLGHLDVGARTGGPLLSGGGDLRRLGADPHHGSIWTEAHRDDVFGRTFRKIVHDNFDGAPLCVPSAADVAGLVRGAELLGLLLPSCARSAFSHAHLAVIVPNVGTWKKKGSCSEFRISGTIFLNREMLGNPWWVAEHLLHESLHQKLYDLRHTHSLLAEDLSPEAPQGEGRATVHAIWNVGGTAMSNGWDTFRAIAAFHVYVHVALLSVQVERRRAALEKRFGPTPEGSAPAITHSREAFERAEYLGRCIKDTCWKEMGPAGRLFVAWLNSILKAIDPISPAPNCRYLHLVLNRYMQEATLVTKRSPLAPEATAQLIQLIDDEAGIVRQVLLAISTETSDLQRLEDARARRPDEDASGHLLRFRGVVTGILHGLSPDGYGLRPASPAESAAPLDDKVRAMVDASTTLLMPMLDGSAPVG